jgi:hypothetical protein
MGLFLRGDAQGEFLLNGGEIIVAVVDGGGIRVEAV